MWARLLCKLRRCCQSLLSGLGVGRRRRRSRGSALAYLLLQGEGVLQRGDARNSDASGVRDAVDDCEAAQLRDEILELEVP